MRKRFFDLAFTPTVQAQQTSRGSRSAYAALARRAASGSSADRFSEDEIDFIKARDSFYLATVSETGWPYVQHRGGPAGFVRHLHEGTLGWADYAGNRQYVSIGNTTADDRVAMLFMDYPHQQRLKILGHLRAYDVDVRPDLAEVLAVGGYQAKLERLMVVTIEVFDWNCPQHITPRFTVAELQPFLAPLHARITELEQQLDAAGRVATPYGSVPQGPRTDTGA